MALSIYQRWIMENLLIFTLILRISIEQWTSRPFLPSICDTGGSHWWHKAIVVSGYAGSGRGDAGFGSDDYEDDDEEMERRNRRK